MSQEINLLDDELESSPIRKSESIKQRFEKEKGAVAGEEMRLLTKRLVEALLFAGNEPIPFNKIREVTDRFHPMRPKELRTLLLELQNEYLAQKRGFRLEEIGQGYLLRSCEEFSPYIELLYRSKRMEKLSQAAAEVLAIIAYRQPITRPQIETIRGVDSSGTVASLLERELIEPVGRLEAPGRPTLYGTTNHFLAHFGIRDIKELPQI